MIHQARRDEFLITTDAAQIDLDLVHKVLAGVYWSAGIPRDTVAKGIENSIAFGVYHMAPGTRRQVGFARVISDKATFAYLSDVFVIEAYRGRGLSRWLMEVILAHPDLQGLRRFCLLTRDAHGLYSKFGFKPMPDPSRYMELWDPEIYARQR
jgi:GNAT superfamily N-acetyltransferase